MSRFIYPLLVSLLLLFACGLEESSKNELASPRQNATLVGDTLSTIQEMIEIDSVYLSKVKAAYTNQALLTDYRDSANSDEGYNEYYSMVPLKLNLNGDKFDDYFLLYVNFHHVLGVFVDGYSGQFVGQPESFATEAELFFNRPYPNEDESGLEFEVVNINCEDNQDELMVLYSAGSPPGSSFSPCTYVLLYRHHPISKKVEMVFKELVMEYFIPSIDTLFLPNDAHYIDILHHQKECIDEINVQTGLPTVTQNCPHDFCDNWRKVKLKPQTNSPVSRYVFNVDSNRFELSSKELK